MAEVNGAMTEHHFEFNPICLEKKVWCPVNAGVLAKKTKISEQYPTLPREKGTR